MDGVSIAFTVWLVGSVAGLAMISDTVRQFVCGSLGRPQPIVRLVHDMLDARIGWTVNYHHYKHQTGIEIHLRYDGFIHSLKIDGSPVLLRAPDKLRLHRAVKRLERCRKAVADDRAAQLLAERVQTFAKRAEQFADTVVPFERRA